MANGQRSGTAAQSGEPQQQSDGSSSESTPTAQELMQAKAQMGEVVTRNEQIMQTFIQWQVERASTTDEDQFAIMASIVAEIMDADSVEEVLREREALHARDIVNTPLILHGFELREGTYEDSQTGYYAAMTVSRPGADVTRIVTCGGMKVLAKLMKLDQFGEWPQIFYFTEKKTNKGYGVLDIVRPPL